MSVYTEEEWWDRVRSNWEQLQEICTMDLASDGLLICRDAETDGMRLFLAAFAESCGIKVADKPPTVASTELERRRQEIIAEMDCALANRDFETLERIVAKAWNRAPDDNVVLKKRPGWNLLCSIYEDCSVFRTKPTGESR